jgi:hypothetical protein
MVFEIRNQHAVETHRGLLQIATEGLKILLPLNGGAAVAILAYLGNLSANATPVPDMRLPMGFYIAGLVLCGLAYAMAYLTQFLRLNELLYEADATNKPKRHKIWLGFAFSLAVLSLLSFAAGSFSAVTLFE